MEKLGFGLLIVSAGVFCVIGAFQDWDFFMESRRAQLWVSLFGRDGARVFYYILGGIIAVVGVTMMFQGLMS